MGKNIFIKLFICVILIAILSILFCTLKSHASSLSEIFSDGKAFLEDGKDISDTLNTTELQSTSDYIYNALFGIAVMVAVVVAMVLGIQFMASSADEKAKIKEALMPFVAGCIVVFGSFTIWKIAVNIGNNAEGGGYSSAQETTEAAQGIISGEIEVSSLSDNELKDLYNSQYVGDDLHTWTTSDPRAGGRGNVMTLEQAINNLSEYKRKIYNEAKNRGLLKSDGIYLK